MTPIVLRCSHPHTHCLKGIFTHTWKPWLFRDVVGIPLTPLLLPDIVDAAPSREMPNCLGACGGQVPPSVPGKARWDKGGFGCHPHLPPATLLLQFPKVFLSAGILAQGWPSKWTCQSSDLACSFGADSVAAERLHPLCQPLSSTSAVQAQSHFSYSSLDWKLHPGASLAPKSSGLEPTAWSPKAAAPCSFGRRPPPAAPPDPQEQLRKKVFSLAVVPGWGGGLSGAGLQEEGRRLKEGREPGLLPLTLAFRPPGSCSLPSADGKVGQVIRGSPQSSADRQD